MQKITSAALGCLQLLPAHHGILFTGNENSLGDSQYKNESVSAAFSVIQIKGAQLPIICQPTVLQEAGRVEGSATSPIQSKCTQFNDATRHNIDSDAPQYPGLKGVTSNVAHGEPNQLQGVPSQLQGTQSQDVHSRPQGVPSRPQGVPSQSQGTQSQDVHSLPQGVPSKSQGPQSQDVHSLPQGVPSQSQGTQSQDVHSLPQGVPSQSQGSQPQGVQSQPQSVPGQPQGVHSVAASNGVLLLPGHQSHPQGQAALNGVLPSGYECPQDVASQPQGGPSQAPWNNVLSPGPQGVACQPQGVLNQAGSDDVLSPASQGVEFQPQGAGSRVTSQVASNNVLSAGPQGVLSQATSNGVVSSGSQDWPSKPQSVPSQAAANGVLSPGPQGVACQPQGVLNQAASDDVLSPASQGVAFQPQGVASSVTSQVPSNNVLSAGPLLSPGNISPHVASQPLGVTSQYKNAQALRPISNSSQLQGCPMVRAANQATSNVVTPPGYQSPLDVATSGASALLLSQGTYQKGKSIVSQSNSPQNPQRGTPTTQGAAHRRTPRVPSQSSSQHSEDTLSEQHLTASRGALKVDPGSNTSTRSALVSKVAESIAARFSNSKTADAKIRSLLMQLPRRPPQNSTVSVVSEKRLQRPQRKIRRSLRNNRIPAKTEMKEILREILESPSVVGTQRKHGRRCPTQTKTKKQLPTQSTTLRVRISGGAPTVVKVATSP